MMFENYFYVEIWCIYWIKTQKNSQNENLLRVTPQFADAKPKYFSKFLFADAPLSGWFSADNELSQL